MPKYAELTGKRYGHLVVLGPIRRGLRIGWQVQCDCGRVVETTTRSLNVYKKRTCSHTYCFYYKALLSGYVYTGDVPLSHLHTAEELRDLVNQPCTYCGKIKHNGLMPSNNKHRLLPVCVTCREMRNKQSHLEFMSQIKLIATVQMWTKRTGDE